MYPIWKQFCLILLLTLLGTCYSLLSGIAPLPWAEPEIGPGEILVIDAKVLDSIWVDARSAEEFGEAHIPGALHFDTGDEGNSLLQIIQQWLEQPRPIVVYCSDAGCGTSRKVAETLRENLPDAEIYSLKGGWDAWQK
jgi:rhodanese-related sulfurtransferase